EAFQGKPPLRLAKKANAFSAKGVSLRSARRRHKLRIPPPAAKRQAALTPLRLLSPPDPLRWAPAGAPCGKRFDARSAQSVFPTYTPPEKRFHFLPPPAGGGTLRGFFDTLKPGHGPTGLCPGCFSCFAGIHHPGCKKVLFGLQRRSVFIPQT